MPKFASLASAEAFARRFRILMGYHDLTLRDLASATHSAISTVGTWKNGRVPSDRQTLLKLAEIFHVGVEYLVEGSVISPAGLLYREEADSAAGRILEDIDLLHRALADHHQTVAVAKTRKGNRRVQP